MITVAPLAESDLPALIALFAELTDELTDYAPMAANFRAMSAGDSYILLGAKLEGELVGFVMGIICLDIVGCCRPFLVVENVIVAKAARRQGVARRLWDELEAEARRRGCYYVFLVSVDWREDAHRFYASVGFAPDKYKGFKKYLDR
ncbi:N-acetyltransferase family protein [Anaeroselena agilis]|uniref:GNAT family N-acetyltransferase n=1 Tax=Anaeroselena agilis TaxID=3063788 RepID=A0ABU3P300_9FIRM|nr:GNAT family N-acetyltransferase [Selenomonadales bacterium 4137-cl]